MWKERTSNMNAVRNTWPTYNTSQDEMIKLLSLATVR